MTFRTISALVVLPALVLGAAFSAPQTAEAACNYNGFVHSNGQCSSSFHVQPFAYPLYSYNPYSIQQYINYLQELIAQLQGQVDVTVQSSVDVTTRSAVNIEDDRATPRGHIDLHNQDDADVYFEYGRSRTNLDEESSTRHIDENDDDNFKIEAKDLRDDTTYYFRAVGEDNDGNKDYGLILSFRTDTSDNGDTPLLQTKTSTDITDHSARLRGYVDMNNYQDGIVFFVYGQDESQVADVTDDFEKYNDIEEDGEDLQRVKVDIDLDGSANYSRSIVNLDSNTDHYFNICVEYEDNHNDPVLACGEVESFATDN